MEAVRALTAGDELTCRGQMDGLDLASFRVASKPAKFAEFLLAEYTRRYAKACRLMEHEELDALLVPRI